MTVSTTLSELFTKGAGAERFWAALYGELSDKRADGTRKLLSAFLRATMDEVRVARAEELAAAFLEVEDIDDTVHFRHGVLRRERGGDIAYTGQRDHAAHTVNNYLLGWALYLSNERIYDSVRQALATRSGISPSSIPRARVDNRFNAVWLFASLLHDVGYLLEGGLGSTDTTVLPGGTDRGAQVVRDYFQHRCWTEFGLNARHRQIARDRFGDGLPPSLDGSSLGSLAAGLTDLGNTSASWSAASAELRDWGWPVPNSTDKYPDAFGLWRAHFKQFGSPQMVQAIELCQENFGELAWRGLPKFGQRVIDHGVASGLILLRVSTLYFQLSALLNEEQVDPALAPLRAAIHWREERDGMNYGPYWWWHGVLWGTGAAAVHNVLQMKSVWKNAEVVTQDLSLPVEDAPIASLGILVDVLQEWDRYSVRRGGMATVYGRDTGEAPVQSTEVELDLTGPTLRFAGWSEERLGKLRKELDRSLEGWEQWVTVQRAMEPGGGSHQSGDGTSA
ncbi:MAG: hypothetical protein VX899_25805 [Myxococcota bacterium]|nr:hypothetical protein [Myxococcota bacterium]